LRCRLTRQTKSGRSAYRPAQWDQGFYERSPQRSVSKVSSNP
jgi:hypothetical protein